MNVEHLGYGTHLTVDVYQAAGHRLEDPEVMLELLGELAREIETGQDGQVTAQFQDIDGSSAALVCPESQFYLHFFPEARLAHFRVFTRRDVGLSALMARFRHHLHTGRFESQLSTVSKLADHNEEHARQILAGDRSYTRARFEVLHSGG